MDYIFVSSKRWRLNPYKIDEIPISELKWALTSPVEEKDIKRFTWKFRQDMRMLQCYSGSDKELERGVFTDGYNLTVFDGYILDNGFRDSAQYAQRVAPEVNAWGMYSCGHMKDYGTCSFAVDEMGLAPLYYASNENFTLVSNNANLLAIYLYKLGYPVEAEESLPVWFVSNMSIESEFTGYSGIYRVNPFEYIKVDYKNNISYDITKREPIPQNYEEALELSKEELTSGIKTLYNAFPNISSDLTGGYDTRMVFASALSAGLEKDIHFTIAGKSNNPDVIISKMIAEHYGINLNWNESPDVRGTTLTEDDIFRSMRKCLIGGAAETGCISAGFSGIKPGTAKLSGHCGIYTHNYYANNLFSSIKRKYKRTGIDLDNLTESQFLNMWDLLGYSDIQRFYFADKGWDVFKKHRRELFYSCWERFHSLTDVGNSVYTYRLHNHHGGLLFKHGAGRSFLNNPTLVETARLLTEEEQRGGKLVFDLFYSIDKELVFFPFENREWNPLAYKDAPEEAKKRIAGIKPVETELYSIVQNNTYNTLVPWIKDNLINKLPESAFNYIKKDNLEEAISELPSEKLTRKQIALVNLSGYALWRDIVKEKFPAMSK